MSSRRPALVLLLVMVVVALTLSAAERERTNDSPKPAATTTTVATPAPAAGREVLATLPADSPVRARVGDTVVLRVRSETADIASMLELGLQTSVGPAIPGELRFVAEAPGTFPVMLTVAGTKGGLVEVSAAKRQ